MKFVGIGDLVLDCYCDNSKIISVNGGKSFSNIIFNLQYLKNTTKIMGCCGNNYEGEICISSLNKIGVDVSNVSRINSITRRFYIYGEKFNITKKENPFSKEETWYKNSKINVNNILKNIECDDILIFDDLNTKNIKIINEKYISNDILIDIGYIKNLKYLSKEQIINLVSGKFRMINLNERVEEFLIDRFKINSILELRLLLNCEMLIVTRGKSGADFVFEETIIERRIEESFKEIDANGAGDMFFASIISDYYNNIRNCDILFENAVKLVGKVITKIGARGYYQEYFKI